MKFDYIKGHMGNNIIIFLYGNQVPKRKELEVALEVLEPHRISGHEVGILYPPSEGGDLMAKIVGFTSRTFNTMCGGMTQVLGKAIVETDLSRCFNLLIEEPETRILIETDSGPAEIKVEVEDGKVRKVWTDMHAFVRECYDLGISFLYLGKVPTMKVGKFLMLNADEVKRQYPEAYYESMNNNTKQILLWLQQEFRKQTSLEYVDFSLYDWNPRFSGDVRVVFPHNLLTGHVEPSCGTGFVATGIGLWELGDLEKQGLTNNASATICFECGAGRI